MAVNQLSDRSEDGTCLGYDASDPIAFYGATPSARIAFTTEAVATTNAVSTTSNNWGFATSTQANNIVSLVNEIRDALITLGLKE